eukprot:jgi/Ulvmu1/66/UM001_0069.1
MVQSQNTLNWIPTSESVVKDASEHVQQELLRRGVDASHDWTHIERVARLSERLLSACQPDPEGWLRNTVALCAILHDMADWKYCDSEKAGLAAVTSFLASRSVPQAVSDVVDYVLKRIGFKESLKKAVQPAGNDPNDSQACIAKADSQPTSAQATVDPVARHSGSCQVLAGAGDAVNSVQPRPGNGESAAAGAFVASPPQSTEEFVLRIVQDADRLDALGAIGVARCLTFGGRFNRTLYDPAVQPRVGLTKEQYTSATAQTTTINHFAEKLFLLEDLMHTHAGRALARERTMKMRVFLRQFEEEWRADDFLAPDPSHVS